MKKRTFDILIASVGLAIAAVPMMGLYVASRFTNGNSGFFMQERIGKDRKPFTIYKFKTMKDAFDSAGNPVEEGQRVSALGDFMRRRGLDELPQLINVLRGDMSLVGPRPIPLQEVEETCPDDQVFSVLPGLVSPYTIRRFQSGIDNKSVKNQDDLIYASSRVSLRRDTNILVQTFAYVMKGQNPQIYDIRSARSTEGEVPEMRDYNSLD